MRAGVLGRLALAVVEVRGHGDDRLFDRLAEVLLGDQLHLLQHVRGDLGDRVRLVAQHDAHVVVRTLDDPVRHDLERLLHRRRVPLAADQPLRRVDRVLGVGDRLALGDVADEPLAVLGDRDHRRRRLVAAAVRDHDRRAVFDDGHARVRRARGRCRSPSQLAMHRSSSRQFSEVSPLKRL